MKSKQPAFLDLLERYLTEYMPVTAGKSENTIRLYKITFRLLLVFLHEKKGIEAGNVFNTDL